MKQKKLEKANAIQQELQVLKQVRDGLSGKLNMKVVLRNDGAGELYPKYSNISDELALCEQVSKAILKSSVNDRIAKLESKFKNL